MAIISNTDLYVEEKIIFLKIMLSQNNKLGTSSDGGRLVFFQFLILGVFKKGIIKC